MNQNPFGDLSDAELDRIAKEVTGGDTITSGSFDITDNELFAISTVQEDLQRKFAEKPATQENRNALSDELTTRMAEIGFEVVVAWKDVLTPQGVLVKYPDVTFVGRIEGFKETDHDRKRWDALRVEKEDIPNPQLVD